MPSLNPEPDSAHAHDTSKLAAKAGCSGRLAISYSRPCHVIFFSSSRPLALQQQAAAYKLQPINISFLYPGQHHHSRLNHFRIYFLDNKIEKIIV
jgi:hypothetical protein